MRRLVLALINSLRAFRRLLFSERAFQQEFAALCVALPLAWFIAEGWRDYLLLVGAVLLLVIVEVLNTAIEAACNAVSREFSVDIQLAKDCGSLAVLLALLLAVAVWLAAIVERISS